MKQLSGAVQSETQTLWIYRYHYNEQLEAVNSSTLTPRIQAKAVYPFHDCFLRGTSVQTMSSQPCGAACKLFRIGNVGTPAATGGTEGNHCLTRKIITFHKGTDNPRRFSPPDGVFFCQVRTKNLFFAFVSIAALQFISRVTTFFISSKSGLLLLLNHH